MEEGQVPVKLTDVEWRQRSEELAKAELAHIEQEAELNNETEEWKDRKKYLRGIIAATEGKIRILAREVDTREAFVDAQQTLPGVEPTPEPDVAAPDMPEPGKEE